MMIQGFQQGWYVCTGQLLSAMASMLCAVGGDAMLSYQCVDRDLGWKPSHDCLTEID